MKTSGTEVVKHIQESEFAIYLKRYRARGRPLTEMHEYSLTLMEFLSRTATGSARRWLRSVPVKTRELMAMDLSHRGYLGLALAVLGVTGKWHLQAGLPRRPLSTRAIHHRKLVRSGALGAQATKLFWVSEVWELIANEHEYLRELFPPPESGVSLFGAKPFCLRARSTTDSASKKDSARGLSMSFAARRTVSRARRFSPRARSLANEGAAEAAGRLTIPPAMSPRVKEAIARLQDDSRESSLWWPRKFQ